MYTPFKASSIEFEDVVVGEGAPITSDDQLVLLDVTIASGDTGESLVETAYDGDLTTVSTVSRWEQAIPGFEDALDCATEGSRVVVALPPESLDAATAESVNVSEGETVLAVVDIRRVFLSKAEGTEQFNVQRGLPSVVRAPNGRPGIIVPDAAAPTDVVSQTLIAGSGPVVTGDEPVRVNYTGLTWAERTVFDTTWDKTPASFDLDTTLPAFAEALIGQTVGSQVLVVIPPDQGYGSEAQATIPADSTLVFVVDILGIDAVPAAGDTD